MDKQTFSESFKRMVVEQVAQGRVNIEEARRLYNIRGHSAIQRWQQNLLKYGRCSLLLVTETQVMAPPAKAPSSSQSTEELQARIKLLERQLEDEQLRLEAYRRMIEIAERDFNIPIRKKSNTK
ncbi:hypothetical protein [Pedobacter sp. SYSU D00535]|uniref:hypothetical protein n=1 Tax=Pedobacter sp. SYSU D00535 TaxID=2810308 RepID=UPI001A978A74|nr:hypothetical protein [Pedobacter sp. SYSU D00535]